MRRFAPLTAVLIGPAVPFGCAPTARVVTVERDVWQSAVVAAPGGAVAVGPLAEKGGVSAEVGIAGAAIRRADRTREEGALGHLTVPVSGQGRLTGRLGRYVELGVGGELLPGDAAVPAATNLDADDIDVSALIRGGPQLRLLFDIGDAFAFGGDFDIRFTPVQVQRDIAVQVVEQEQSWDGWDFDASGDSDAETWVKIPALTRFATGIAVTPGKSLHLSTSLVFQETVRVDGHTKDVWQCTYDTYEYAMDPDEACVGPSMPPVLDRVFITTLSGGLGLRLGRTWLLGQTWVHLDGDGQDVVDSTPLGGSLSLRVPLFRARPDPVVAPASGPEGWRQVAPRPAQTLAPSSDRWRELQPTHAPAELPLAIPVASPSPSEAATAAEPPASAHAPPPVASPTEGPTVPPTDDAPAAESTPASSEHAPPPQ